MVSRAGMGSTHHERPDLETKTDQVSGDFVTASAHERRYVFNDRQSRAQLADEPGVLAPEAGTCASQASTFAGNANVLAGEASADCIHGNSVCCQSFGVEGSDVIVAGHSWPMLRQHGAAKRFDFAEGDGLKSAAAFKAEAKPAYAAEQIKQPDHRSLTTDIANTTAPIATP